MNALTPGDKLKVAIDGGGPVAVTFGTNSVEVGVVRYHGVLDGKRLWVLSTPTSEHFFGIDEIRDVRTA